MISSKDLLRKKKKLMKGKDTYVKHRLLRNEILHHFKAYTYLKKPPDVFNK